MIINEIRTEKKNQIPLVLQLISRRYGLILVIAWLAVVFLLISFVLPSLPTDLNIYLFQPVFWLSLAGLSFSVIYFQVNQVEVLQRRDVILLGALLGGFQVAAGVLLGLLLGFGRSPYARDALHVVLNLWFAATQLVGIEFARWYLVKIVGKKSSVLGFALAWLLPLLLLTPIGKYSMLGAPESAFRLAGGTLLPAAAENLLAVLLSISGGPLASIAYRGLIQAFEWLSPILPNLPWMAAAFVGVMVPVAGLAVLNSQEEEKASEKTTAAKAQDNSSMGSWVFMGVAAVIVIWLNTGILGIRPTLMSGISMNPTLYAGDVVITRNTTADKIRVGDIIRYRRENIEVVHRVKEIQKDGNHLVFITRGDNNNADDGPVMEEQYQGKVILTLPKIGWIGIYFRQGLAWVGGRL